jgi:ADP-ribose diphosphatase
MKRTPRGVKILGKRAGYRGHFRLDLYRLRHRLYAGGWSGAMSREIFERGRTVGILLYDPKRDALVLVEQFRLAAHLAEFPGWELEIVAGILDKRGERPEAVAVREAHEEAGVDVIGRPLRALKVLTTPGGSTETFEVFCGRVDSRGAGGIHGLASEHEDIKVVVKNFAQVATLVARGHIQNGPTLLALQWFAANRAQLRRRWR